MPRLPDLVAPREQLAYYDQQTLTLTQALTALQVWQRVMAAPLPGLQTAFRLRDAVAARFGVKRIGGFSGRQDQTPQVGGMLDFFRVERAEPDRLTLTERDRHLDVMIAVCTTGPDAGCDAGCEVSITASVVTHNVFGRLYMIPVAPAHRLIVWLLLRRLQKSMMTPQRSP